jgi:hypothetical protein
MLSNFLRRPFTAAAATLRRKRGLEEFFEGGPLKPDEPLVVGREWKVSTCCGIFGKMLEKHSSSTNIEQERKIWMIGQNSLLRDRFACFLAQVVIVHRWCCQVHVS